MKRITLAVAVAAAALLPQIASAQGYLGFGVGQTDFSPNRNDWTPPVPGSAGFDDTDLAWKIYGGYRFTPNWGLELSYADLGRYEARPSTATATGLARVNVKSTGLYLTGTWPLTQAFSLTGKVGAAVNRASMSFSSTGVGFLANDSGSSTRTRLAAGVGATYSFTRNVAVRLEWETYGKAGTTNGGFTIPGRTSDSSPGAWTVGGQFSF